MRPAPSYQLGGLPHLRLGVTTGHDEDVRRTRWVLVPPALGTVPAAAHLVECWQRRYRCTDCGAVSVVLPRGVLPRFLHSVAAIVLAVLLVAQPPLGDGLADAQAYARQGLFARLSTYAEEPYRWRSLDRWAAHAPHWWSGWGGDLTALILLFAERARTPDRADILNVAVAHHVRWGGAR